MIRRLIQLLVMALLGAAAGCVGSTRADDAVAPLVSVLQRSNDATLQRDILRGMYAALQGKSQQPMPAGWQAAADRLARSDDAEIRTLVRDISSVFGDPAATAALRRTVANKSLDAATRRKALQSLVDAHPTDLAPLLQRLCNDDDLRDIAFRGLAGYDDEKTPAAILAQYRGLTPELRRDALNTLASRVEYARILINQIIDGRIDRKDLTASVVRQLAALHHPEIDAWLGSSFGTLRSTPQEKLSDIARFRQMVLAARPGQADRLRGRAVFQKTCAQCHTLFGEGGHVGPNLTGSGRADLDYLLSNVVDPNAIVARDYQVWVIRTRRKRIITGLITQQDATSITVVTENETVTVSRKQIDKMRQDPFSMMPEGLLQGLKPQDLLDLVSYLRGATQVPAAPASQ